MDYVVIDLETTGFDPVHDRIMEIGAVKISAKGIAAEFEQLVNPGKEIPAEITSLTGISQSMVDDQPSLAAVLPALESFIDGAILVAHNASFDRSFLAGHLCQSYYWLDTLELARTFLPRESRYSLPHLAKAKNLSLTAAHRALADAQATARLFLLLITEIDQLDIYLLETIAALTQGQEDFTAQWLGQLFLERSKIFGGEKISSRRLFQTDNSTEKTLFSSDSQNLIDEHYRLSAGLIENLFAADGICAEKLTGYEFRPPQLTMAKAVATSLNSSEHLVVEAGTGTGKSLAYLLPAIIWAVKSGQRVVISTHTLNLQEQLLTKDIPLAREVLDFDVRAAAVKGRSHYLCIRKWEHNFAQTNPALKSFMRRLVLWLAATETGDCHEIALTKKELLDWQGFSAVGETCQGAKCPNFRGRCFVSRARKRAVSAQILVANHSLLLANAQLDENVLPEYSHLIIDEAHHLEKVAEDQFGADLSYPQLMMLFNRIKRPECGGLNGFLDGLAGKVDRLPALHEDIKSRIRQLSQGALSALAGCFNVTREFFSGINYFFFGAGHGATGSRTVRIVEAHRQKAEWENVLTAGENLIFHIKELLNLLLQMGGEAKFLEAEYGLELPGAAELNILIGQLKEKNDYLGELMKDENENLVSWVESSGEGFFPSLHSAPVEVKELLNRYLFASKSAVVLTSATLTVNQKFDFYIQRIGIDLAESSYQTLYLESPFAYQDNVLLRAVADLPDPGQSSDLVFADAVSSALIKLIQASQGRALVLFTSHHQLRRVFTQIQAPLRQAGITVLAHGISGSRSKILDQFKADTSSVILGANSFWEGIDVMGESLSAVIIVKLPFWPPSMPTVAARLERMKAARLEGFYHYSLPEAVIRFKQGFGRLIRSATDYGVVCILDRRIFEKKYGSLFVRSLPGVPLQIDTTENLGLEFTQWLAEKSRCGEKSPSPQDEKMIR